MLRILTTLSIILLISLPCTGCGNAGDTMVAQDPESATPGIMTGQIAPDFMLRDLNDKPFRLSDLRDKKPVLLIFWATWCPACIQAIPAFADIQKRYEPRGLEVVSINIAANDPLIRVQRFQETHRLPYRILYDEQTDISRRFAVLGIPTSLIIDRHGIIQYRGNLLPRNVDQLLDRLLEEPAAPSG